LRALIPRALLWVLQRANGRQVLDPRRFGNRVESQFRGRRGKVDHGQEPPVTAANLNRPILPGRLHAKSLPEQHFREVVVIPACIKSLVLDTNFQHCFLFQ
jgi:hypothetical protein